MQAQACGPLVVLIVEDRADTAESTAELLDLCGHAPQIARTGAAALDAAALDAPDVVLLDLRLPDMDGWDVARALRTRAAAPQPVLIAVTGRCTEADRQTSAAAGIDLHLVKPVAPEVLLGLLARIRDALVAHRPAQVVRV